MNLLESTFLWIGTNFTAGPYLLSSKIQGLMWSLADIVLIYFLLKIMGLIRVRLQKPGILYRYLLLYGSAILTPWLFFIETPRGFFLLESIICGAQFAIIFYTILAERKNLMEFMKVALPIPQFQRKENAQ